MKILSVVGARPEFVQAMPVTRALAAAHQEILVHTGQHYDYRMSQQFFDELELPLPHYNLGVGSASQARQTAEMMVRFEEVLLQEQPDLVLVRGDTNSTLAAALVAAKMHIALAHIEAGERSFNRHMAEETNRLVADRLSSLHFCVSQAAVEHLAAEGITGSVFWVGDVMLDAMLSIRPLARRKSSILEQLQIEPRRYALATIHRAENTDHPARLRQIVAALNAAAEPIILPLHPRTRKAFAALDLPLQAHIRCIEPVGYLDMLVLEENAHLVATDSGGVQREAYYLGVPCLTLRDETEWAATVATGWNVLTGADTECILEAWNSYCPPQEHPPIYGDGTAAQRIAAVLGGDEQQTFQPLAQTQQLS